MCFGKSCKHEDWTCLENPAIKGLNSNYITDRIIASQRLSTRLIREFDLLQKLVALKVRAVINLQEPGEHASCGDGILQSTGFSYDPEDLYKRKYP